MKTSTIDTSARFSSAEPASRMITRNRFKLCELNGPALRNGHVQRVTNGQTRSLELFYRDGCYWVRYADTNRVPDGYGQEVVTCEPSSWMAQTTLNTYRTNEPGIAFRMEPIRHWEDLEVNDER